MTLPAGPKTGKRISPRQVAASLLAKHLDRLIEETLEEVVTGCECPGATAKETKEVNRHLMVFEARIQEMLKPTLEQVKAL
jgi:hypothetical protein